MKQLYKSRIKTKHLQINNIDKRDRQDDFPQAFQQNHKSGPTIAAYCTNCHLSDSNVQSNLSYMGSKFDRRFFQAAMFRTKFNVN